MIEAQLFGMKRLAQEARQSALTGKFWRRDFSLAIVYSIAHQCVSKIGEMNAELVRAAGAGSKP
jgi:hypothetical protein